MKIKDLILLTEDKNYSRVLEYIAKNTKKAGKKRFLITINTEIIMLARSDASYEKVIRSADLIVPDGIGVLWASKLFGHTLDSRVHGVDLVEKVVELSSNLPAGRQERQITIGLVGGSENVALKTKECLEKMYPKARISFAASEWSHVKGKKKCDVLFVAFGSPKQEKWIYKNLPKLNVKVAVGVGGSFDFISGKVRRAPKWIQRIGLEWVFRLAIQPWRIKRQLAIPKFILLVLKERFI